MVQVRNCRQNITFCITILNLLIHIKRKFVTFRGKKTAVIEIYLARSKSAQWSLTDLIELKHNGAQKFKKWSLSAHWSRNFVWTRSSLIAITAAYFPRTVTIVNINFHYNSRLSLFAKMWAKEDSNFLKNNFHNCWHFFVGFLLFLLWLSNSTLHNHYWVYFRFFHCTRNLKGLYLIHYWMFCEEEDAFLVLDFQINVQAILVLLTELKSEVQELL